MTPGETHRCCLRNDCITFINIFIFLTSFRYRFLELGRHPLIWWSGWPSEHIISWLVLFIKAECQIPNSDNIEAKCLNFWGVHIQKFKAFSFKIVCVWVGKFPVSSGKSQVQQEHRWPKQNPSYRPKLGVRPLNRVLRSHRNCFHR